VDWVNLLLAGDFDKDVNTIIYGGRLIALSKKDGGIRPINVGYTPRRLGFMDDVTLSGEISTGRGCLHNSTSQCDEWHVVMAVEMATFVFICFRAIICIRPFGCFQHYHLCQSHFHGTELRQIRTRFSGRKR